MKKIYSVILTVFLSSTVLNCAEADPELTKAIEASKESLKKSSENAQKEKIELAQALQASLGLSGDEALTALLAQSLLEERGKTTFTLTGEPVLQYSFKTNTANLETPLIKNQLTYFGYIPLIGKYADPYVMLNPIAIIENKEKMVSGIAPESLLKEIAGKNIRFYTLVWGLPVGDIGGDKTYNLIHHPAAVAWLKGKPGFNESNFIHNITMGIFNPDGISGAKENSAAINSLKDEAVSIHPSPDGVPAFSPNNVRFSINPNREIATFWSAALSPDKKDAVIAFNIIMQNPAIQYNLFASKKSIKTPKDFWGKLISFAFLEKLNNDDAKILESIIAKLIN